MASRLPRAVIPALVAGTLVLPCRIVSGCTRLLYMSDQDSGAGAFFRAVDRPEYLRTCKKCGYTWKVNGYYSKPRVASLGGIGNFVFRQGPSDVRT